MTGAKADFHQSVPGGLVRLNCCDRSAVAAPAINEKLHRAGERRNSAARAPGSSADESCPKH